MGDDVLVIDAQLACVVAQEAAGDDLSGEFAEAVLLQQSQEVRLNAGFSGEIAQRQARSLTRLYEALTDGADKDGFRFGGFKVIVEFHEAS